MNNTRLSPIGKTFAVLLLAGLLAPSAPALGAGEDAAAAKAARITYDDHISEIFRSQCFKCHNQDRKKGGLALNTYGLTMEGGSSGKVVKPVSLDGVHEAAGLAFSWNQVIPPASR